MTENDPTDSIVKSLAALQAELKKLELWSRSDLAIPQIQKKCREIDILMEEIEK